MRVWPALGLIAAVALVAYLPSLRVPFLYDDHRSVLDNPSIRQLSSWSEVLSPPPRTMLGSRPVANLSLALNFAAGGTHPAGYHAVNAALHLTAAFLLFGVVRRTVPLLGHEVDRGGTESTAVGLAAVTAALWAAHPLLTNAVTYVSQRTEVLMGICYLGTLYGFLRGATGGHRAWLAVSVACCTVGVLCKEVIVTAPLAVLVFDRLLFGPTGWGVLRRRAGYYAALAATWLVLAWSMQRGLDENVGVGRGVGVTTYALTQVEAVATYVARAFWPQPLVFDYGPRFAEGLMDVLLHGWAPLALLAGVVYGWSRSRGLALACGSVLLVLAPTSSVIPVTLQPVAENRCYLPSAALIAIATVGIHRWVGRRGLVAAGLALGALVVQTRARNETFQSPVELWRDTVAKRPDNFRARLNLAEALTSVGRLDDAAREYQTVLTQRPDSADAHLSYSSVLFGAGRLAEAAEQAARAVQLEPQNANARSNLAAALLGAGRMEDGIRELREAIRLQPQWAPAHLNLALALARSGRPAESLEHFDFALRSDLANASVGTAMGDALWAAGQRDAAVRQLQLTATRWPQDPQPHLRLGALLYGAGQMENARSSYQAAVRVAPAEAEAHFGLGASLAAVGRLAEATAELDTALRLKPDHAAARELLGRVRAAQSAGPAAAR